MAAYLIGEIDMITCKEDLIGTYVDGRDIKLGSEYQKLLFKFGVKWLHFDDQEVRVASGTTNHFCFNGEFLSWNKEEHADINYEKRLTLKDLKPKPTKFVKVEESIFDLKEEFERGELYEKGSSYTRLISESDLAFAYRESAVYRQVEIDWRDEVVESLPAGYGVEAFGSKDIRVKGIFDKEQALILANAIIESLTDKPE